MSGALPPRSHTFRGLVSGTGKNILPLYTEGRLQIKMGKAEKVSQRNVTNRKGG